MFWGIITFEFEFEQFVTYVQYDPLFYPRIMPVLVLCHAGRYKGRSMIRLVLSASFRTDKRDEAASFLIQLFERNTVKALVYSD